MRSLYFEEFEGAPEVETEARTLTREDIRAFADVSWDENPLHLNEDYASASIFGGVVAHGLLGLAAASGLMQRTGITGETLVAFTGLDWRFKRPIRPGDTVRVRMSVLETKPARRQPDAGAVTLRLLVVNQDDRVVQEGEFEILVKRRDS